MKEIQASASSLAPSGAFFLHYITTRTRNPFVLGMHSPALYAESNFRFSQIFFNLLFHDTKH